MLHLVQVVFYPLAILSLGRGFSPENEESVGGEGRRGANGGLGVAHCLRIHIHRALPVESDVCVVNSDRTPRSVPIFAEKGYSSQFVPTTG